jgi:imidazolonepropionase-like amidohydrolase
VFGKTLMADFLSTPALAGSEYRLMAPSHKRLDKMHAFVRRMIKDNGVDATVTATTDRRKALAGADYVVVMLQAGGVDQFQMDYEIPLKYGVDQVKLNLSGDNFVPGADAKTTWMTDAEVAACAEEVRMRGKRIVVHARSCASVKQALRHGIRLIYHASFTDTEALDMLEAARDEVFVAPGIGILYALLYEADPWGVSHEKAVEMGLPVLPGREWELIFASGMSTADKVDDISGRGVGMAAVKSDIEKAGYELDVHTTLGKGTMFIIRHGGATKRTIPPPAFLA